MTEHEKFMAFMAKETARLRASIGAPKLPHPTFTNRQQTMREADADRAYFQALTR